MKLKHVRMTVYGENGGKEFSAARDIDVNLIRSSRRDLLKETYRELCHNIQCHTLQDYSLDYARIKYTNDGLWGFWDKSFNETVTGFTSREEAVRKMKEYDVI